MEITFPDSSFEAVQVPESSLVGVCGPGVLATAQPLEDQLAVALARPVGTEPLSVLLRPGMRVLVVVEDHTAPTPTARILPVLLAAIQSAGVAHRDIEILVATASRRQMTETELRQTLGDRTLQEYAVAQHDWRHWSELATIGDTADGYPVIVNRRLAEADVVVGVRHVVPDRVTGFTGGYEIVDPGCFGDTHSTRDISWLAALYPTRDILGRASNPVRQTVEQIGRLTRLAFVVHVVLDGRGDVAEILAGDPVAAYRASAMTAFQVYGIDPPSQGEVVIADARSDSADLLQAARALYGASLVVRPGGAVILVAECPEGVAPNHPQVLRHRVSPLADLERDLSVGTITDVIGAAFLAMVGRSLESLGSCFLASHHVSPQDAACLGIHATTSPREAFEQARTLIGHEPRVLVLRDATTTFPRQRLQARTVFR